MSPLRNPFRASCEETAALMSAYAEGELRGPRRRRVMRHLIMCEICAPIYRSLVATIESVRSLGRDRPPPSAAFVDDVVRRLQDEEMPEGH